MFLFLLIVKLLLEIIIKSSYHITKFEKIELILIIYKNNSQKMVYLINYLHIFDKKYKYT
jgi:hypothetical protein